MSRFTRLLILWSGIAAMVLLGYSMLRPRSTYTPDVVQTWSSPDEELEYYLRERADYRRAFARILAEKRIARAEEIAATTPAYAAKAGRVVDSVRARLARGLTATHDSGSASGTSAR